MNSDKFNQPWSVISLCKELCLRISNLVYSALVVQVGVKSDAVFAVLQARGRGFDPQPKTINIFHLLQIVIKKYRDL